MQQNRKSNNSAAGDLENLQKIDDELQDVFASLSPSLEALAKLAPEDQVANIKSLINDLKNKAANLADENAKIKELVDKFQGKVKLSKDSNFFSTLFENKIVKERFRKITDPACNKAVQVRIY